MIVGGENHAIPGAATKLAEVLPRRENPGYGQCHKPAGQQYLLRSHTPAPIQRRLCCPVKLILAASAMNQNEPKPHKDPELPDRFARLVLWELADIHAILLSIQDHTIIEKALRPAQLVDTQEVQRITQIAETKRNAQADRIYADLLERLRLNA